jgi:Ca2+/Na+ antiporter
MAGLAEGIGGLIGNLFGSSNANAAIQAGMSDVSGLTQAGVQQLAPYNEVGASYLGPVAGDLLDSSTGSSNIGQGRINAPTNPVDFENFASNFNESEGAKYLQQTATEAQNSTAAAKGGLLSGANLRSLTGITEGIANQDLLEQYKAFTSGQQQDFQQRETSYQNLYGQEAMGLQAATAEAGTFAQGARAMGSLAGTQATIAQQQSNAFGSSLGNIFKGIASLVPGGSAIFG